MDHQGLLRSKYASAIMGLLIFAASPGAMSLRAAVKDEAVPWPEITEQERALKSVPQDPEADAVILRRTRQGKIVEENHFVTNYLEYHWRMKILNERGKKYSEVHIASRKYSEVSGIEARTIKPDGTVVPVAADQIFEKLV